MKAVRREFLLDLRAAIALGTPEAMDMALLTLRAMPEVRGNHVLEDSVIDQLLLPAGELLGDRRVPFAYLEGLSRDSRAAIRALAAGALVQCVCREETQADIALFYLAADTRPEVRQVMALAGRKCAALSQMQPLALAQSWLRGPGVPNQPPGQAARRRVTALNILEEYIGTGSQSILSSVEGLQHDSDPDVRAALASLLSAAGKTGWATDVMTLLEAWAGESQPDAWVICRVLSARWAANMPERGLSVLKNLEAKSGATGTITKTRQALVHKAEKTAG